MLYFFPYTYFYNIYICSSLNSSQNPPYLPNHITLCSFFYLCSFFQKQRQSNNKNQAQKHKIKTRKQNTNKTKSTKMKQKVHRKDHAVHVVLASYSWAWALSGVWLTYPWHLIEETDFSFANSFLIRAWTLCIYSSLNAGTQSGLTCAGLRHFSVGSCVHQFCHC